MRAGWNSEIHSFGAEKLFSCFGSKNFFFLFRRLNFQLVTVDHQTNCRKTVVNCCVYWRLKLFAVDTGSASLVFLARSCFAGRKSVEQLVELISPRNILDKLDYHWRRSRVGKKKKSKFSGKIQSKFDIAFVSESPKENSSPKKDFLTLFYILWFAFEGRTHEDACSNNNQQQEKKSSNSSK